jgi:hypothetical protein
MFSLKKTFSLEGFEPGSSVLEADAMSSAPRRKGLKIYFETLAAWSTYIVVSSLSATEDILPILRYYFEFFQDLKKSFLTDFHPFK